MSLEVQERQQAPTYLDRFRQAQLSVARYLLKTMLPAPVSRARPTHRSKTKRSNFPIDLLAELGLTTADWDKLTEGPPAQMPLRNG